MPKNIATIAEGMSANQAGKMADQLLTHCRKHGTTLPRDVVQEVLKQEGDDLAKDQFDALRKRVERRASLIVRKATVNYDLAPKEVVDATGRTQYVDQKILATMPKRLSGIHEVEVIFFPGKRSMNAEELEAEFNLYNLEPDPRAQAQVNTDDPEFAKGHPNATQWSRDAKVSSFLAFDEWLVGKRGVDCGRRAIDWFGGCWFSGVRKVSK